MSLSFQKSSLELREGFHLDNEAAGQFAERLHEILGIEELLVVSTCNRTEVYYHSHQDHSLEIIKMLCIEKTIPFSAEIAAHFEVVTDNREAVQQLFEVSIGLRSQVLGDLQIAGQLKQAYSESAARKLAGPFLHRLMHTIFHASKRVHQETAFRDGAASLSYVAADLSAGLAGGFANPRVLILGAGEMARDAARNVDRDLFSTVSILNRTYSRAQALAEEVKAVALPYEDLGQALMQHDVVISAVSVETPAITREMLSFDRNPFRPLFLVDLSMPRSIAKEVDGLPGVVLYDLDDLRSRSNEALNRRNAAVPQVQAIIQQEMDQFLLWSRELTISPVIQQLRDALENIRKEEMARYLTHLDDHSLEIIEKITRGMVDKIVKLPVLQLKAACRRGDADSLIGVLQDLFDLEKQKKHS